MDCIQRGRNGHDLLDLNWESCLSITIKGETQKSYVAELDVHAGCSCIISEKHKMHWSLYSCIGSHLYFPSRVLMSVGLFPLNLVDGIRIVTKVLALVWPDQRARVLPDVSRAARTLTC
jgi:hypothetical protein